MFFHLVLLFGDVMISFSLADFGVKFQTSLHRKFFFLLKLVKKSDEHHNAAKAFKLSGNGLDLINL